MVELAPGPLRIQGSWRPGAPYRGTLRLESSIASLPARNLLAEGVEAKLSLGAAPVGLAAEVILDSLPQRAEAPGVAPLVVKELEHVFAESCAERRRIRAKQ